MMHHAVCASPPQPDEDYATPKRMMRSNSVRESPRKDDALRRHPRARSEYDGDDEPDTDPLDFVCRQSSVSMDDGDLSECESGCYCGGYGASQCTFTSGVITPERKGLKLPHLGALNSSAVGDELHCAPLPLLERENGNLFSLTGTSSAGSRFLRRDNGSRRIFDRSPNRDDPRRRPGDTSKGGLSSNTDFSAQLSVSIDFDRCSRAGMIPAAEECEGSEVDALAITATPITLNGITEKAPAVCRVQLRALSRVSPRYVPFSPNNDAKIDAPASATPREEVDGVCYVVPRNLSSFRRRSGGHEDGTMLNEVQGYHSLVRDVDTGRYPGMRVQGAGLRFKPANPVERTTGEEDDSALHSLTGNSAIIGIWQRSLRSSPSHPDFLSTSGSLMETRKRSGRIQRSFAPPMTPLTARPSIPPPLHPPRKLAAAPTLNANNKTSAPVSVVSYVASGPSPLLALTPSLSMSRRSSMKYGSTTAVSVMDNYHFNSSMASPIGQAGSSSLKSPLLLSRLATRRNQAPIAPVMSSTERVSFVHLAD